MSIFNITVQNYIMRVDAKMERQYAADSATFSDVFFRSSRRVKYFVFCPFSSVAFACHNFNF